MKNGFMKTLAARSLALLALMFAVDSAAAAEVSPSKPVRIIVPAASGGSLDITTRLVAQKMGEKLGQSVIVDNRPGADTLLGTRLVKDAPADGYTILAQANGFSVLPALKLDPGYDPLKDFTAIGPMVRSPLIMVVAADQPDRTLQEFIARAKTNKLSYASGGAGTPPQLAAAMFLQQADLNVLHVPYKGNGAALPDVAAGRVNMLFDGYISSASYLKAGKLKALAVTSSTRIAPLPDVPTFTEQGVNYTYTLWLGLLAPSGTSKEVVQRLSDALHYATTSQDLSERFRSEGSEPMAISPDEFNEYLMKEVAQMTDLATTLKITKE
jgi:tripartite-type tricarboxylate transporter receptor subunit TctC